MPSTRAEVEACNAYIKKKGQHLRKHNKSPYSRKFGKKYMDDHDGEPPSPQMLFGVVRKRYGNKGACKGIERTRAVKEGPRKKPGKYENLIKHAVAVVKTKSGGAKVSIPKIAALLKEKNVYDPAKSLATMTTKVDRLITANLAKTELSF